MMWGKIGKAIFKPHLAIAIVLALVSGVFLIYACTELSQDDPLAIISYVTAFYALCVWVLRIPKMVGRLKKFKRENRYVSVWENDVSKRVKVSLYASLVWNCGYAVVQIALGVRDKSLWFFFLALYYILLALMRFLMVNHVRKYEVGEKRREEIYKYRICGIIFLMMNLAVSGMMFYMIFRLERTSHGEVATIALATYTFTQLTFAIVNCVKYRKYHSRIYSATKAISLTSAVVSVISLESVMLNEFSKEAMSREVQRLFLILTGAGISAFIVVVAIYMIYSANRELKEMEGL